MNISWRKINVLSTISIYQCFLDECRVWIQDWIKATSWQALLEGGLVLSPQNTCENCCLTHYISLRPSSLISSTRTAGGLAYFRAPHFSHQYILHPHQTHTHTHSFFLSLRALGPSQSLHWLDENASLKSSPKFRLSFIVYSSCCNFEESFPSCSAATGEHATRNIFKKFTDFIVQFESSL